MAVEVEVYLALPPIPETLLTSASPKADKIVAIAAIVPPLLICLAAVVNRLAQFLLPRRSSLKRQIHAEPDAHEYCVAPLPPGSPGTGSGASSAVRHL